MNSRILWTGGHTTTTRVDHRPDVLRAQLPTEPRHAIVARHRLRLVLGNLVVVLALWFLANLTGAVGLVAYRELRAARAAKHDFRIGLPAVEDRERAGAFYREFNRLETRYAPFEGWHYAPFEGRAITVDESGRRTVRGSASRPHRVHIFGGSTTWGTGVWDDETLPAQVGHMIDAEAVNHGQSGFVSRQELEGLLSLLNSPELITAVVFYDGVNDINTFCTITDAMNGHGLTSVMDEATRAYTNRPREVVRSILIGGAMGLREVLRETFGTVVPPGSPLTTSRPTCARDPTRARRVADTLWANWNHARQLLAGQNVPFLAVLQPTLGAGHPDYSYIPSHQLWLLDEVRAVYPLLRERINGQEWLLDLTGIFDDAGPIFLDWTHVSARGNAIAARAIAARLQMLLAVSSRADDLAHAEGSLTAGM